MAASSLTRILALGILSDNDPVQVPRGALSQRGLRASKDLGRPNICVLLEGLTDGKAQTPEGYMVRDI
jgi:hypothetical protein